MEGVKVVGLDNMNHYYDVRLKEARLNELEQFDNFSFVKGNLADKAVIESILMLILLSLQLLPTMTARKISLIPLQLKRLSNW